MNFVIKKAERRQARLRLGLCGPSGSGKTYGALRLAKGICREGERIGLIDTERRSASLYADNPELAVEFDVIEMEPPYSPERYRGALHTLEKAGYAIIIVDQISHAWAGEGGLLEYVDTLKAKARNALSPWMQATPAQNRLVDALLRSPAHIIATMRSKSEWVIEDVMIDGRTKKVPRKIGLAPVQRDGIEYEFTTMLDIDVIAHSATATKDRSGLFGNQNIKLDEAWGKKLRDWLESGLPEENVEPAPRSVPAPKIDKAQAESLRAVVTARKMPPTEATHIFNQFGFDKSTDVTSDRFNDVVAALQEWVPS